MKTIINFSTKRLSMNLGTTILITLFSMVLISCGRQAPAYNILPGLYIDENSISRSINDANSLEQLNRIKSSVVYDVSPIKVNDEESSISINGGIFAIDGDKLLKVNQYGDCRKIGLIISEHKLIIHEKELVSATISKTWRQLTSMLDTQKQNEKELEARNRQKAKAEEEQARLYKIENDRKQAESEKQYTAWYSSLNGSDKQFFDICKELGDHFKDLSKKAIEDKASGVNVKIIRTRLLARSDPGTGLVGLSVALGNSDLRVLNMNEMARQNNQKYINLFIEAVNDWTSEK